VPQLSLAHADVPIGIGRIALSLSHFVPANVVVVLGVGLLTNNVAFSRYSSSDAALISLEVG
jgi:hypothetical protein